MFDYELPTQHSPLNNGNLDDRRPRKLVDIVGQAHIISRLSQAARNGVLARRYAFIGPTGAGKTTLATTVARMFFCPHSGQLGDACGTCKSCRLANLPDLGNYHEWTGAQLNDDWDWWRENGKHILERPTWCFFLDEVQDLAPHHQKAMFRQLETARALVLFATTHEHLVNDALLGRFGTNKFEVYRPSASQAVDYMEHWCQQLGVKASRRHLLAVAQHYGLNLRHCVDFIHAAREQTTDGVVTDEFVISVTGQVIVETAANSRSRVML